MFLRTAGVLFKLIQFCLVKRMIRRFGMFYCPWRILKLLMGKIGFVAKKLFRTSLRYIEWKALSGPILVSRIGDSD